jgi:hypothetical protein
MWHAIGQPPNQLPADWLARPDAQRFVQHLRTAPPATPAATIADIAGLPYIRHIDADLLFVTTQNRKRGLWAHWQIALAYAQYLDPAFHAWCNAVVRDGLDQPSDPPPVAATPLLLWSDEQLARLHDRFDTLDRHAGDILFLLTAAQELVLGNRRPFSGRSQAIIRTVVASPPFAGRCPCCHTTSVVDPDGQVTAGAEFDHFFHRGLNRPEFGWIICLRCHEELNRAGYLMRFSKMVDFRRFQAAVLAFRQAQYRSTKPTR